VQLTLTRVSSYGATTTKTFTSSYATSATTTADPGSTGGISTSTASCETITGATRSSTYTSRTTTSAGSFTVSGGPVRTASVWFADECEIIWAYTGGTGTTPSRLCAAFSSATSHVASHLTSTYGVTLSVKALSESTETFTEGSVTLGTIGAINYSMGTLTVTRTLSSTAQPLPTATATFVSLTSSSSGSTSVISGTGGGDSVSVYVTQKRSQITLPQWLTWQDGHGRSLSVSVALPATVAVGTTDGSVGYVITNYSGSATTSYTAIHGTFAETHAYNQGGGSTLESGMAPVPEQVLGSFSAFIPTTPRGFRAARDGHSVHGSVSWPSSTSLTSWLYSGSVSAPFDTQASGVSVITATGFSLASGGLYGSTASTYKVGPGYGQPWTLVLWPGIYDMTLGGSETAITVGRDTIITLTLTDRLSLNIVPAWAWAGAMVGTQITLTERCNSRQTFAPGPLSIGF
jgi:hypothetical protein